MAAHTSSIRRQIAAMRSFRLLPYRHRRPGLSAAASSLRFEVRPPSLRVAPPSAWQRLIGWLVAPAAPVVGLPLRRLPRVRADFRGCVADVALPAVPGLLDRIDTARSLRELWHLRADVYGLVGLQHGQIEAERRVGRLNRHFPARVPRSTPTSF